VANSNGMSRATGASAIVIASTQTKLIHDYDENFLCCFS
jgi:hypothetical protein